MPAGGGAVISSFFYFSNCADVRNSCICMCTWCNTVKHMRISKGTEADKQQFLNFSEYKRALIKTAGFNYTEAVYFANPEDVRTSTALSHRHLVYSRKAPDGGCHGPRNGGPRTIHQCPLDSNLPHLSSTHLPTLNQFTLTCVMTACTTVVGITGGPSRYWSAQPGVGHKCCAHFHRFGGILVYGTVPPAFSYLEGPDGVPRLRVRQWGTPWQPPISVPSRGSVVLGARFATPHLC